jgi:hypothetical protein
MKKCKLVILSMILVTSIFTMTTMISCNKNEPVYSCDEKIDQKVKENRDGNQNITRYELAHLEDLDYQMGVFLSLTSENKVRIFNEKITSEQNNTHLNSNEKAILNQMIAYLVPDHYTTLNAEFQDFSHSKETILRNTYGWDDAKVFIFSNSWMLESEILDYIAMKASGGGGHGGGGVGGVGTNSCTCYYGYYCWIKGGGSGTCVTGNCTKPNGGCGVFGTTNCDGKCQ